MGKIAAELDQTLARHRASGAPGRTFERVLATHEAWSVADVVCTSGPGDRTFEEQDPNVSIAVVLAGSFQYRSPLGRVLMTPGSLLLGNAGQCFECGHDHAAGDRCVAFRFAPDYFDRLAADAGLPPAERRFRVSRLPPVRESSSLVARASDGLSAVANGSWEEVAIQVATTAIRLAAGITEDRTSAPPGAAARVTHTVRTIQHHPGAPFSLDQLAADAGQSPFHYLRTFRQLTGVTPHQFILRARLREAATRLAAEDAKVIDIALQSGFGDLSNFNRSFRIEFGVSPTAFRRQARAGSRVPT